MFKSLKSFFAKGDRATWCLFGLLVVMLFVKTVLFHWYVFHSIIFSSLWKNPLAFFTFYLPKLSIALLFGSPLFFFRRKYYAIYLAFIIDIWLFANLIYFRAYGILLDAYSITMAGNMSGFWDSIFLFMEWKDSVFFLFSILFSLSYLLLDNRKRAWKTGFVWLSVPFVLHFLDLRLQKNFDAGDSIMHPNCFSIRYQELSSSWYEHDYSILHSFFLQVNTLLQIEQAKQNVVFTENDLRIIQRLCTETKATYSSPQGKVIVVLVESFEDWALREDITPHLCQFMQDHHVLYCNQVKRQVRGGCSSDAQLIVNTGLLPIQQGAVCYSFPQNVFPSLAELYPDSTLSVSSSGLDCWNQKRLNVAYHFSHEYDCSPIDSTLFTFVLNSARQGYNYIQVFTMSSHSPFTAGADRSNLHLPSDMPVFMHDYLKAINATDAGLSVLLNAFKSDTALADYTLVITGDHTIFHPEKREQFDEWCKAHDADYEVQRNYCPLVIYSPRFTDNFTILDEECYLMDVYPTLLHLMGCEDWYWKGFGVNLLDSVARTQRPCTEEEAYQLSDKLIRSNWFATKKE